MAVEKDPRQLELTTRGERDEPRIVAVDELRLKQRLAYSGNYRRHNARRLVQFIVIHCTDGHEGIGKDDDVAAMFARVDLKPRRSCHYVVDTDSATRCVPDKSVAWHCGRTGNLRGLGIELCGRARQTRAEWLDALSFPMLCLAARLVADLCQRHGLPRRFIDAHGLRMGATGITTHAEVGYAWRETRHTDPGPHFPIDSFMAAVQTAVLAPTS